MNLSKAKKILRRRMVELVRRLQDGEGNSFDEAEVGAIVRVLEEVGGRVDYVGEGSGDDDIRLDQQREGRARSEVL